MSAVSRRAALRRRRDWVVLTVLVLACSSLLVSGAFATDAPSIGSDKTSYAPGDTVVLTGAGWASGETVHITVDDAAGDPWTHEVDVTAAADGSVTDSLSLPDVSGDYTVAATAPSGTANATFTVSAPPAPAPPPPAPPTPNPTVTSDRTAYAPGDTVQLSGANWPAGSSVHVVVDDDTGDAWAYAADVTAGVDGSITDSFALPSSFAAGFTVTASEATSGASATASFNSAFAAPVGPPTIASDLADYAPGQTVTLTGASWQPGESVHIFVNDDVGQTWSRNVDVTADASGRIVDQFQLPNYFVATYSVTATGAAGERATTSFTDADTTTLTQTLSASTITYGGTVTTSGTLKAGATGIVGATITLESHLGQTNCGGSFTTTGFTPSSTTTGTGGVWPASGTISYKPNAAGLGSAQATFAAATIGGTSYQKSSDCDTLTVNTANTTTTASSTAGPIFIGGNITVDYTVSSSNGISGNTATGTAAVIKDTGPGNLNCTATSTSVSAAQDNSGFAFVVNGSTNTANRFTCTPSLVGTYTFHVGFTDSDGNYNNSASATGGQTVVVKNLDATSLTETLTPSTLTYGERTAIGGTLTDATTSGPVFGGSIAVSSRGTSNGTCGSSTTAIATTTTVANGNWDSLSYAPSAGSTDIQASYAGDAMHSAAPASSANCKTVTVSMAPTAATLTLGSSSITTAGSTTASGTVLSHYGVAPNHAKGTLAFQVFSTTNCSGTALSTIGTNETVDAVQSDADNNPTSEIGFSFSSAGTHTISGLAVGTYGVRAAFTDNNGQDGNYLDSSQCTTLTVTPADSTPPVIGFSQTPNGDNNWFKTAPATLHVTATDASGIASLSCKVDGGPPVALPTSGGDVTTSTDGDHSVQCQAVDGSANANTALYADNSTHLKLDTHAPTVGCGTLPTGWQAANVSLSCTASDSTSNLANPADATFQLSTNVAPNTEDASASTGSKTVKDNAGNSATAGPYTFMVDRKAPTVTCPAADTIWHDKNVSVDCTVSDGGSGPVSATVTLTTSVGAGTETATASTGTGSGCDNAGNCTPAGPVGPFKIDRKAPVVTCGTPDTNWHSDNQSVHCTATDDGSGVSTADASFDLSTSVDPGTETDSAQTGRRVVQDAAGNAAAQVGPFTFKIDRKAPVVTCDTPDTGWHADDQKVHCTATDHGAGVSAADADFYLSTNVDSGTETDSAQTDSRVVQDAVGNEADQVGPFTFKIDKKAPQQTGCDSPDTDWHNDNVTLHCSYADGGSGPATQDVSLSTSVGPGNETANAAASAGTNKACDAVGNCADPPADIPGNKIDRKAPQESSCDSPDGNWHAADVTLKCHYTDAGSGPATQDVSLSTSVVNGNETDNALASAGGHQACDAVGNCAASPDDIGGNQIDKKKPAVSCDAADGAWHGGDVSIGCTATDGGSGLGMPGDASFSLTTNVPADSETNNASTGSREVCDAVHNCSTAGPVAGNKVDKKAPDVSCGSADSAWHGADVSIGCTATDGGSGLHVPADASFSLTTSVDDGTETSNASTGSHPVCDDVGNCRTAGPIDHNMVDRKAPQKASCQTPDGTWHATDVTLTCHYTDGGSGPADQDVSLSTSVAADHETANAAASAGGQQACDAVGNCAPAPADIGGNMIDKKAPQLGTCDAPDGVWHGGDVTLKCHYTDGGSGPATKDVSLSTNVSSGTETSNAAASAGGAKACDAVGNCADPPANIGGNMIDKKAPQQTSCDAPDANWHANDVTLKCHYSDGGSGPATQDVSLTTNVAAGTETSNASASAGTSKACDNVDNCAATPSDIGGNKVDKKGPAVTVTCPSNVIMGSAASASWTAADGGSGVATGYASGTITGLDTSSIGTKYATAPAGTSKDNVNNGSPLAKCSYNVIFNFHGFFQPVDNLPTLNAVKAGSAVPVKFDLGGNQGLNIFASGSPTSSLINCATSAPVDDIEATVTAGNSSLNYDATVSPYGQYIYVWKTDKAWGGTCRQFTITLSDGTTHIVQFKFSK